MSFAVEHVEAILLADGWHWLSSEEPFKITHAPPWWPNASEEFFIARTFVSTDGPDSLETQPISGPLSSILAYRLTP